MNKKNNGKIPECRDERLLYVSVGCGKCKECRGQKKRNWQVRLHEELKTDNSGKFITLTFDSIELDKLCKEINVHESNAVATIAVRRFLERWRKKYKKSVKHWLITELGHNETERIHLHGILFTNESKEDIEKLWGYGYIWIGKYVNGETINYLVKYMTKLDLDHKGFEGKVLCSAGIGKDYTKTYNAKRNKYTPNKTIESYKLNNGAEINLPIYYRNKIYTEEEREKLWVEKIEKGVRYCNGVKYEYKTEEQINYFDNEVLKYNQIQNEKLGYGNDSAEWKKIPYNVTTKMLNKAKKLSDLKQHKV